MLLFFSSFLFFHFINLLVEDRGGCWNQVSFLGRQEWHCIQKLCLGKEAPTI